MNKAAEQFKRVERWYKLLEKVSTGIERNQDSNYYEDIVYAFFQNCWHLKDWIINSKTLDTKIVHNFIHSNKDLEICRDLANGSKHLVINKPSVSSDIKINKREYSLTIGRGDPEIKVTYWIEGIPGVDAFSLATNCYAQWKVFLINQGVLLVD